jgi:hypothetical protein
LLAKGRKGAGREWAEGGRMEHRELDSMAVGRAPSNGDCWRPQSRRGAGRGRAEAPHHGRRRARCSSSDQRRCRALAGAEVALGKKAPVPAARQEKQGECRAMAGLAPCALPAARGGRTQGEKKWRLGKNRGVGMEIFQVSTPNYRRWLGLGFSLVGQLGWVGPGPKHVLGPR